MPVSLHSSRSKVNDEADHEHIELYHPTGSPVFDRSADAGKLARTDSGRRSVAGTSTVSTELESASGHEHIEDINAPYGLRELEQGWQYFQPYLKSKGYALRPRYAPGWVGSWVGKGCDPLSCEDSIVVDSTVIDAVRVADKSQVIIKVHTPQSYPGDDGTPALSSEIDVLSYFSAEPQASDPRNHCVPLLDVLSPEDHSAIRLSVMPLFRDWYAPPMRMVVEALAFIHQMLEGLAFMHSHHIAHCNIVSKNILMDARDLFPAGFHGAFNMNPTQRLSEDHLPQHTRLNVSVPVRYFYIDFALSVRLEGRTARWRGGAELPEVAGRIGAPYDPFKGDVYALGRVFDHFFSKGHKGLDFLAPLFATMLAPAPAARPGAADCLAQFDALTRALPRRALRARLGYRVRVSWAEWRDNVLGYWALRWALCTGACRAGALEF